MTISGAGCDLPLHPAAHFRVALLILFSIMRSATAVVCVLLILLAPAWASEPYSKAAPVELNKDGKHWVEQTLKKLSLEEKVGQMLSVRYFTDFQNFTSDGYQQFRGQIRELAPPSGKRWPPKNAAD